MKLFLLKVVLLACIALAFQAVCLVGRFVSVQMDAKNVYVISPTETIIFTGGSQSDASIAETNTVKCIKKICLHSSSSRAFLVRLLELESRNQLRGIRFCVLETAPFSYARKNSWDAKKTAEELWLREFPINWRYWRLNPYGLAFFGSVLLDWVAYPRFAALELNRVGAYKDGESWTKRCAEWKKERIEFFVNLHFADYERRLDASGARLNDFLEIKRICDRHGIRPVVIVAPLLMEYRQKIPALAMQRHEHFIADLRAAGFLVFSRMNEYADDLFFDPTHLAHEGAVRFTTEFLAFLSEFDADRGVLH